MTPLRQAKPKTSLHRHDGLGLVWPFFAVVLLAAALLGFLAVSGRQFEKPQNAIEADADRDPAQVAQRDKARGLAAAERKDRDTPHLSGPDGTAPPAGPAGLTPPHGVLAASVPSPAGILRQTDRPAARPRAPPLPG